MSECLPHDIIEGTGIAMGEICTLYKAVVSKNQTLINSETPIVYTDSQNQVPIKFTSVSFTVPNDIQLKTQQTCPSLALAGLLQLVETTCTHQAC